MRWNDRRLLQKMHFHDKVFCDLTRVVVLGHFKSPLTFQRISGISVSIKDIRMWKGRWSFSEAVEPVMSLLVRRCRSPLRRFLAL